MIEMELGKVRVTMKYPGSTVLLVLGGRPASPEWIGSLEFNDEVWAIDRGVDSCHAAGITPGRLIGDDDSAQSESWKWAAAGGALVSSYESDKNLTDFQLALDILASERGAKKRGAFLTCCFGGRFDHLWSLVVSFLHRSERYVPVGMADENEGMIFLRGPSAAELTFSEKPKALSILPFTKKCQSVSLTGTRWPLKSAELDYGFPYSVSNRLDDGMNASVSIGNGLLGFYWIFAEK